MWPDWSGMIESGNQARFIVSRSRGNRSPGAGGSAACDHTLVRVKRAWLSVRRHWHNAKSEPDHQQGQQAENTHGRRDKASSRRRSSQYLPWVLAHAHPAMIHLARCEQRVC